MPEPSGQAASQLANVEADTGRTLADFTAEIRDLGLEKHGEIRTHFKEAHGLGHGNANLLTTLVREALAGGPPPPEALLEAQYAGAKAHLRPILDEVWAIAESFGDDVESVIQKTGVSFRRRKQFALVQAPSSRRVQVGLNLPETPDDGRVSEVSGMCTHRLDLTDAGEVDDAVAGWVRAAYEAAG